MDNANQDIKFDQFCDKIDHMVNVMATDEVQHRKFAFACFDTMFKGRLTEEGLFKFL